MRASAGVSGRAAHARRLLVTLATDQAATELLFAAKTNLKKADPNSAAHKVYFNPDLSPQEAQKTYFRRYMKGG